MHQYKPPDYLVERLDCCEVGVSNWDLNPQPLCQSSVLYQTVGLQHRLCNCNVYCTVLVFGYLHVPFSFLVFACTIFIFGICMCHFYFWYLHVSFLLSAEDHQHGQQQSTAEVSQHTVGDSRCATLQTECPAHKPISLQGPDQGRQ